jgi:hypothetical protein
MVQLVLTPEQTRIVQGSRVLPGNTDLLVLAADGTAVGRLVPQANTARHFSAAEIAEIEGRIGKDGPYVTTAELLGRLSPSSAAPCDSP